MSVEMAVWRMTDDGPQRLGFSPLGLEAKLEDMLTSDPGLAGLDVLVVGRQVPTAFGGFIDVLGVDVEGRVHILELKRDKTPRDVVAQALDYGSWAQHLTLDDVAELWDEAHDEPDAKSFDDAFAERFDRPLPDVFNADQQLTIVASELDAASDRIVEYLAERFGVPVNAVFFRHFVDGDRDYLARTWLLAPEEAAAAKARTSRSKVKPWNGRDFYVVLGNLERGTGRWDLARRYGLISAGGGSWYWKPLRNLVPGKRVFAYVGGAGYVGVGVVRGEMLPAREAKVEIDGRTQSLRDLPDLPSWMTERGFSDDEEVANYVVPVEWIQTRDADSAVVEPGLFASQVTVCKLRDQRTIDVLEDRFNLEDAWSGSDAAGTAT